MSTLAVILGDLPTLLRKRYQDAFWIRKANQILGEIETEIKGFKYQAWYPLILSEGRTIYPVPSALRTIDRVRVPDSTGIQIDSYDLGSEVHFRLLGDNIVLQALPDMSGLTAVTGTATAATLRTITYVTAVDVLEDQYAGKILMDTSNGGFSFITSHPAALATESLVLTLNAELSAPLTDTTPAFAIQHDFYICEGQKRMTRFTATSETVPLPVEREAVMVKGLRYHGEIQTDEESQQVAFWKQEYLNELDKFQAEVGTPTGDRGRNRPKAESYWSTL